MAMRHPWVLAVLLAWPVISFAQASSVLHVTITIQGAPVARHALLISDNPATSAPRRVLTRPDGTVDISLRPGSYTVESDRPFVFAGKAYQWTQMVDLVARGETTLSLTSENAELVPLEEVPAAPGASGAGDSSVDVRKWEDSVVGVWSPTSRASGFLVDAQGLIATTRAAVGTATTIEVQLSPTLKVPARVLPADSREVAIAWVDPSVIGPRSPIPLSCAPPATVSLDDGQHIVAIAAPLRTGVDQMSGQITALQPRAVETDLRLAYGGTGGPVFNGAGALVGLMSLPQDEGSRRRTDVIVVRAGLICEAIAAARAKMAGATPPPPTPLPLEPARGYPAGAIETSGGAAGAIDPPVVSSTDFDVAFITPPMIARADQRAGWTGGRSTRPPEAEARIGRLTEFGGWSEYFTERPAVVIVRVTPKMAEGFWKRLGREAARTQGAVLPAFKDFKTRFLRMRASCGGTEVTPIHPMVLEHQLTEADVVREGLYVFDPGAFGPQCGTLTLSLYSEKSPERADAVTVDPKVIDRIWQDFAPYRSSAK